MGRASSVVHVVPYYPPHLGGMENVAKAIAEAYAQHHPCEVLTTTCGAGTAPRHDREDGVDVRRCRGFEFAHTPIALGILTRLIGLPRRTMVHVHVAQAVVPEMVWLSSVLRRRPFVAHFHLDVDASGPLGKGFLVYKKLVLGRVLRAAATVICLSNAQADFLTGTYQVEPSRIEILPNGVASAYFSEPRTMAAEATPLKLLYVGRLTAQKNVGRLVEAMAAVHHPVELAIVGEGEERPLIEEVVRRYDLTNVRLVGAKSGAALIEWYQWAEAFILPSEREGMPLVLLEAMAAALPIIATDVVGSRELVGDVGLLASPDVSGLARAIELFAVDPTLRAELAERSSRRAREYRWDNIAARLEGVYGAAMV